MNLRLCADVSDLKILGSVLESYAGLVALVVEEIGLPIRHGTWDVLALPFNLAVAEGLLRVSATEAEAQPGDPEEATLRSVTI